MILGHKSIKSTETYIHLEKMLYEGGANDQFTVKVANTLEEEIKLMEVGFEYHAVVEGTSFFGNGNDILDYSKTQGIISQPLYLTYSKSLMLIFSSLMSCLILGSSDSTDFTSLRTVLQMVA
jgi:hypothetical protein